MSKYVEPMVVDENGNIYYSAECINGIKDKQQEEIKRLSKTLEEEKNAYNRMYNMYVEKDNIINELEKWLRSDIKRIEELQNPAKSKVKPYGVEYNNYTLIIGAYDNALDKLQELKGEDKE